MDQLNSNQLENFFKKSKRFFNKYYPIIKDEDEMETIILTENVSYSLIHSFDRHRAAHIIGLDIKKIMGFNDEESIQLAKYYIDLKYDQYMNYILSL